MQDPLGNEKDHKAIPSRPENSISADAGERFLIQEWTWTTLGRHLQLSSCSHIRNISTENAAQCDVLASIGRPWLWFSTQSRKGRRRGGGEGMEEEKGGGKETKTSKPLFHPPMNEPLDRQNCWYSAGWIQTWSSILELEHWLGSSSPGKMRALLTNLMESMGLPPRRRDCNTNSNWY